MATVKARYECLRCLRFIWGGDVRWKLPEGAVMTDDLRSRLTGPYCPHCGSDNVYEVLSNICAKHKWRGHGECPSCAGQRAAEEIIFSKGDKSHEPD